MHTIQLMLLNMLSSRLQESIWLLEELLLDGVDFGLLALDLFRRVIGVVADPIEVDLLAHHMLAEEVIARLLEMLLRPLLVDFACYVEAESFFVRLVFIVAALDKEEHHATTEDDEEQEPRQEDVRPHERVVLWVRRVQLHDMIFRKGSGRSCISDMLVLNGVHHVEA